MKALLITALALVNQSSFVLAQEEEVVVEETNTADPGAEVVEEPVVDPAAEVDPGTETEPTDPVVDPAEPTDPATDPAATTDPAGPTNTDLVVDPEPDPSNTKEKCVDDNTKIADAALAPFASKI